MSESTLTNGQKASMWSAKYQGTNNPEKQARALEVLNGKTDIPTEALADMATAAIIHGGDMKVGGGALVDLLKATGAIESNFTTKVQAGGGPARGFYQVEPKTARDLLTNSRPLFGPKWKQHFGAEHIETLLEMDDDELGDAIEQDGVLAASFAATKWQVSSSEEIQKALSSNLTQETQNDNSDL